MEHSPSRRLLELERILAQSKAVPASTGDGDADPVSVHLSGVPTERIRRLTAELQSGDGEIDDVTNITMRLLLNDCAAAVAQLRAIARLAQARIDGAAAPIREARKFVQRAHKLRLKRAAD